MALLLLPLQVLLLLIIYLYSITYSADSYIPLQYLLLFNVIISLIYAIKEKENKPLFLVVIMLFSLFIFSRYILDIFSIGITPSNIATRFTPYTISNSTMTESLFVYNMFLVFFCFGFYIKNKRKNIDNEKNSISLKLISLVLLTISLPGLGYKMYITISSVLDSGYLTFYNGISYSKIGHYFEFISYKLYLFSCLLYLSNNLRKREFIFIAIILLIPTTLMLLVGKRNEFAITIIYLLWYWHSYIKKITLNYKNIIISLLAVILLSLLFQKVQNTRNNIADNKINPVLSFVFSQGVSGLVLPYYIDNIERLPNRNYPYILAPIIDRIHRGSQTQETIEKTNYLSYQLTYVLDQESFLRGEGIGTSFITEIYQFGYIGIIIGSILLGFSIFTLENKKKNQYIKYMSYLFLNTILFLPRGELFELFYEIVFYTLLFIILIFLKDIIDGKNRLRNSMG